MTGIEKKNCKILWDYLCVNHSLKVSDIILVCGGHDAGVAKEAARLYKEGYSSRIIVSGGITREIFGRSERALEADILGDIIIAEGVAKSDIFFEREAKNTGENLEYSENILSRAGFEFKSVILVQKPYAQRRTLCLALKKWPNRDILITSERKGLDEYFNSDIPEKKIVSMMVGEVQRLIYSPQFGWINSIVIPQEVICAYEELCVLGYTDRLMSDEVIQKCIKGTQDNISINAK